MSKKSKKITKKDSKKRRSAEQAAALPAVKDQASSPDPPSPTPEMVGALKLLNLIADTSGRVFRKPSEWLTHDKKHLNVLGWIYAIVLLALVVAVVLALLWITSRTIQRHAWTVPALAVCTTIVAVVNTVVRKRK